MPYGCFRVLEARGAQRQQPGRVDLGRHVGELELDRLVLGDRLAERPALLRVGERVLERGARDAERLGRDADPAAVERRHRDLEAAADLAEQVIVGSRTSSRKIWRRLAAADAELVVRACPTRTPLVFIGRMNAVMPWWPAALSFIVNSTQTSATGPLVIQFLVPLMTQPSPS